MNFMISLFRIKNMAEPAIVLGQLDQLDPENRLKGIEVNADLDDPVEVERLYAYGHLLKARHKKLQIHSPHGFSRLYNETSVLDKYLSIYADLAKKLQTCLSITIHPVESDQKEKARFHTLKLITRLISICELQGYDLTFTLENLNMSRHRLDTEGIQPLVEGSNVNFCWDIGHEVFEDQCTYSLDDSLFNKLNNIHIHDINQTDHHPFIHGKTDYVRAVSYLATKGYKGSVVVEINTDYLAGDTWGQKYTDYMRQLYTVSDIYKSLTRSREQVI